MMEQAQRPADKKETAENRQKHDPCAASLDEEMSGAGQND
jgi:hypothetical protein